MITEPLKAAVSTLIYTWFPIFSGKVIVGKNGDLTDAALVDHECNLARLLMSRSQRGIDLRTAKGQKSFQETFFKGLGQNQWYPKFVSPHQLTHNIDNHAKRFAKVLWQVYDDADEGILTLLREDVRAAVPPIDRTKNYSIDGKTSSQYFKHPPTQERLRKVASLALPGSESKVDPKSEQSKINQTKNTATTNTDALVSIKVVMEMTGLARSTIYDKLSKDHKSFDDRFPKRYRVGTTNVRWKRSEVLAWIEGRTKVGERT